MIIAINKQTRALTYWASQPEVQQHAAIADQNAGEAIYENESGEFIVATEQPDGCLDVLTRVSVDQRVLNGIWQVPHVPVASAANDLSQPVDTSIVSVSPSKPTAQWKSLKPDYPRNSQPVLQLRKISYS